MMLPHSTMATTTMTIRNLVATPIGCPQTTQTTTTITITIGNLGATQMIWMMPV